MGVVQLPDELQRMIERAVAEGRAASPIALLEEAVMRLLDDASAEESEARQVAELGARDLESGHYTTIATPEDERLLEDRLIAQLRARLGADGARTDAETMQPAKASPLTPAGT